MKRGTLTHRRGNNNFNRQGNGNRGSRRGNNRRGGRGGNNHQAQKLSTEQLDKQLDAYMNKNEKAVSAKLDAELDAYMEEGQRTNVEEKKS